MYKLKRGVSTTGDVFFTIEVNNKVYIWEVLEFEDETVCFWGEWPEEWNPMVPTYDSTRLEFLLRESRDVEETIRTYGRPQFIAECGLS